MGYHLMRSFFFAESPSALPPLLAADAEPETFDLRAFDLTSHM